MASLSLPVLVAPSVCLIPTTIGGLLGVIGISGLDPRPGPQAARFQIPRAAAARG